MLSRRSFLCSGAAFASLGSLPLFASGKRDLKNPDLRVGVVSDVHIRNAGDERVLLEVLRWYRNNRVDAVLVAGDVADYGLTWQLDAFMCAWRDVFPDDMIDGSRKVELIYVTGNHEWAVGGVPEVKKDLEGAGVTVLSNRYVTLTRNRDSIILAGIDDPNGYADQKTPQQLSAELYAAEGDPFWLLLAHRGNRFPTQYSLLGADLVLSGHGHGGIWRLPFTDGLIGNDFELFPTYMAGFYEENGSVLFATRGLGNSGRSFRFLNRPEVAVLTLHAKAG